MCKNDFNLLFSLLSINITQCLSDFSIGGKFRTYPDEYPDSAIKTDYPKYQFIWIYTNIHFFKSASLSADVFSVWSQSEGFYTGFSL